MIGGISDYDKTEVNDFGDVERLKIGGHICKILGVEIEEITSKKDGKKYNILKIKFDLEQPDEQAGFYQRKYSEASKKDSDTAKWKGYYKVSIPTKDSADFIKTNWKTFLTSVEKSNPGVKIDGANGFDENILVGKLFGGVFGLEEYILPTDGRKITFPRLRFARSVESALKSKIPNVKLLDGTYMDYDDYMEKKDEREESLGKALEENGTIEDDERTSILMTTY